MLSRRGFIRNGLAALAVQALPKATITRALEAVAPEPLPPLPLPTLSIDDSSSILLNAYRDTMLDNIFTTPIMLQHLARYN